MSWMSWVSICRRQDLKLAMFHPEVWMRTAGQVVLSAVAFEKTGSRIA